MNDDRESIMAFARNLALLDGVTDWDNLDIFESYINKAQEILSRGDEEQIINILREADKK
ncbi:MAG: hypothetical protein V2G48_07595 [bacterium JZ-2024 1]